MDKEKRRDALLLPILNQSKAGFVAQVRLMSAMQLFEGQKLTRG